MSRLGPFQHAFVERLSELGVAYPGSPIVEGPGQRYLDDSMRGGRGIQSRFLVMVDDAEESARAVARQLGESFADLVDLRSSKTPGITLVRPDGYVAYATRGRRDAAALASLRSVLERQTEEAHDPSITADRLTP